MASINGNYLGLYVGGQRIALTKSNDFSQKLATEEITTKDSAGFKELQPTLKEANCSMEGICTANLTNLLQFPESLDNAIWGKDGSGSVSGTKALNEIGQKLAQVYSFGSGTYIGQGVTNSSLIIGAYVTFSISLKGSGTVKLLIDDGTGQTLSSTITLSSTYTTYTITHLLTDTDVACYVQKASATAVTLFAPQLEVGQSATTYKGSMETLRDLETIAENRTQVSLLYSDYFDGSFSTAYQGFLTDVSIKSVHDGISTFTCNFQSTGATTITTI